MKCVQEINVIKCVIIIQKKIKTGVRYRYVNLLKLKPLMFEKTIMNELVWRWISLKTVDISDGKNRMQ
jgi:hypothetical protein